MEACNLPIKELHPALQRFVDYAPNKPYCSDNKTAECIWPLSFALNCPYIQFNQPYQKYWLVFDIDHGNPFIWEDLGLPSPNFIVLDNDKCLDESEWIAKQGRSAHLYYAINPVCASPKARRKPQNYLRAVKDAYTRALGADSSYTSLIGKNPLHPRWQVITLSDHEYSLDELSDYAAFDENYASPNWQRKASNEEFVDDGEGRNVSLFNNLRHWAYPRVVNARESMTEKDWHEHVYSKAKALNDHFASYHSGNNSGVLGENEIRSTANSVAKFTWSRYTGSSKVRGTMELRDTDLPLENKQRLSARRTHGLKIEKTKQQIREAIALLNKLQQKVTKTAVAKIIGKSLKTVCDSRYTPLFSAKPNTQQQLKQLLEDKNKTLSPSQFDILKDISLEFLFKLRPISKKSLRKRSALPSSTVNNFYHYLTAT